MSPRNTRLRAATQQNHSSQSNSDVTPATLKKTTAALTKQVNDCTKQQKDLSSSQQFISSQYDDIMDKLRGLTKSNREMRNELNSVVKKCRQQTVEIEQLKTKLKAHEQEKINNNVVIRGISVNDDARTSYKKVAVIAGVKVEDNEISSVRHIQPANKPPAIVVSFNENGKKSEFVKSAKQKRISSTQIGYSGDAYPIFVDHQLTTESFNLFLKAKKIGVSFVWIANGNILLREKVGKQAIKITSTSQLKLIEKELLLRTKKTISDTQRNGRAQHTEATTSNTNTPENERADKTNKKNGKNVKQQTNNVTPHNGSLSTGAGINTNASAVNATINVARNCPVTLVDESDLNSSSDSDYVEA